MASLGPALSATLVTPDLDKSITAYCGFLNQHVHSRGYLDEATAAHLNCPALTGAPLVWLANELGEPWLRFIEHREAASFDPFRHSGWLSLEIGVQDVDALYREIKGSSFTIIGEPADLDLSDDIRAMQVIGPGGEVLYLTQIKAVVPPFELLLARCKVDRLFISVLLTPERDQTLSVYEQLSGNNGLKFDTKVTVINHARNLDVNQRHPLAVIQLAGENMIEIDQLDGLEPKQYPEGTLPAGIAVISFGVSSIPENLPSSLLLNEHQKEYKATVLTGHAGELFELIET